MKKEFSMGTEGAKLNVSKHKEYSEFTPLSEIMLEEKSDTVLSDNSELLKLLNDKKAPSRRRRKPNTKRVDTPVETEEDTELFNFFDFNSDDTDEDTKTKYFTGDDE
jgi:hypothetical protein